MRENLPMKFKNMSTRIREGQGFIAALDQSGGSTPKALAQYGIDEDAYSTPDEMFDLVHEMRSRIITSPAFSGDRIIGAILFEMTMDRDICGVPTAQYLWDEKNVVPFLKIDQGLEQAENQVQLMKPVPDLDDLLARAKSLGVFGTKARSVISGANQNAISNIVSQQFELGRRVLNCGLVPILEPEVTITIPDKAEAENLLLDALLKELETLSHDQEVMIKVSLPTVDNKYRQLIDHPRVLRVVALSGGYPREQANQILARNTGLIASFSRGLTAGLEAQQSASEFDSKLNHAVQSIYDATISL
jgi:fructose-bisphosphate aldolase, class I